MTHEQPGTRISRITTVALPVADAERALAFYVGTLGFEKRRDMPFGAGDRWIEVAPPGAVTTIALAPPGGHPTGIDTGLRLATGDCEADHRALREAGADVDEIMRWPGVPPMFSLRDPDGNTLYVVEG
jgi:catechol 2,3-dioxygenase-like lactoylglutathione lyase family enzyme